MCLACVFGRRVTPGPVCLDVALRRRRSPAPRRLALVPVKVSTIEAISLSWSRNRKAKLSVSAARSPGHHHAPATLLAPRVLVNVIDGETNSSLPMI